jgi:hypothetical protein
MNQSMAIEYLTHKQLLTSTTLILTRIDMYQPEFADSEDDRWTALVTKIRTEQAQADCSGGIWLISSRNRPGTNDWRRIDDMTRKEHEFFQDARILDCFRHSIDRLRNHIIHLMDTWITLEWRRHTEHIIREKMVEFSIERQSQSIQEDILQQIQRMQSNYRPFAEWAESIHELQVRYSNAMGQSCPTYRHFQQNEYYNISVLNQYSYIEFSKVIIMMVSTDTERVKYSLQPFVDTVTYCEQGSTHQYTIHPLIIPIWNTMDLFNLDNIYQLFLKQRADDFYQKFVRCLHADTSSQKMLRRFLPFINTLNFDFFAQRYHINMDIVLTSQQTLRMEVSQLFYLSKREFYGALNIHPYRPITGDQLYIQHSRSPGEPVIPYMHMLLHSSQSILDISHRIPNTIKIHKVYTYTPQNGFPNGMVNIIEYFHKLWHEVIMNPESDYWRSYRSRQIREISPVEALKWEQTMRHLQSLF